ncbi:MAG: hypothetical protein ABGY95_00650, partial [Rubritalea sp.]
MCEILTNSSISNYLSGDQWKPLFSSGSLLQGKKLARASKVSQSKGAHLATGDVEIVSYVLSDSAHQHETIIALWLENGEIQIDASCSCAVQSNCEHCVASIEHLNRGERLAIAFGETPHLEGVTEGKTIELSDSPAPPTKSGEGPSFLLRIERRNSSDKTGPELYASAFAIYDGHRVALEPSGHLLPIVTAERKITRKRETEMSALQTLYALDLLPLDRATSAKKINFDSRPKWMIADDPEPTESGKVWTPDNKQWPHPDFYWQRFRHEATKALETRDWEVQFSAHVGLKPLIFRSETWKAEMVEEAQGWFNLSAGFEIDGEDFELQPILAALLANNFLEATEGMPKGQEFMIFLPDGRGLALPVGRFRHMLTTLGELLEYKFTDGPI